MNPIMSQLNPVHSFTPYFSKINKGTPVPMCSWRQPHISIRFMRDKKKFKVPPGSEQKMTVLAKASSNFSDRIQLGTNIL
jgi:hypothetical protein